MSDESSGRQTFFLVGTHENKAYLCYDELIPVVLCSSWRTWPQQGSCPDQVLPKYQHAPIFPPYQADEPVEAKAASRPPRLFREACHVFVLP